MEEFAFVAYLVLREQLQMEVTFLRKQVSLLQEENVLLKKNVMLRKLNLCV